MRRNFVFSLVCFYSLVFFNSIFIPLASADVIYMIENGNHRSVVVLMAAAEGKICPSQVVGVIDGNPLTACQLVDLNRNNCLVSGQGGYHIKVENYVDDFCPLKLCEGAPLELKSNFDPNDFHCRLGESLSYEKLPCDRFGWYAPSNASVEELMEARVPGHTEKLEQFVLSGKAPKPKVNCEVPSLASPGKASSPVTETVTKIPTTPGRAPGIRPSTGGVDVPIDCPKFSLSGMGNAVKIVEVGGCAIDVANATAEGLNCYAMALECNDDISQSEAVGEGTACAVLSLMPGMNISAMQECHYMGQVRCKDGSGMMEYYPEKRLHLCKKSHGRFQKGKWYRWTNSGYEEEGNGSYEKTMGFCARIKSWMEFKGGLMSGRF